MDAGVTAAIGLPRKAREGVPMEKSSTITSDKFRSARNELITEFSEQRETLWKAVYFRLDHRLCGRIDPDDVLQEAWLDANKRLGQFVDQQDSWTMRVWIKVILRQTLINVHRRHFSSKKRDASREQRTAHSDGTTTPAIAEQFAGRTSTPSKVVMKKESAAKLEQAMETMRLNDQAVLRLRHFEDLTNKEVAERLGISEKAASIRYVRALERLRTAMEPETATDCHTRKGTVETSSVLRREQGFDVVAD